MFKRKNHEIVAETKKERELLHENVRYKKEERTCRTIMSFRKTETTLKIPEEIEMHRNMISAFPAYPTYG